MNLGSLARCWVIVVLACLPLSPLRGQVVLTPEPGFDLVWNGNDGDFFDASPVAEVPDNSALASNGATAISSSDLGPELGIGFHVAANLNDGLYGNANSWISASADPEPQAFAGVLFDGSLDVTAVAFGRDNGNGAFDDSSPGTDCCGGQLDDRTLGVYTLQFTTDGVEWTDIGTLEYQGNEDLVPGGSFTSHFRHRYEISRDGGPVSATGIRILVPAFGLAGGTAIDEFEVFAADAPPPRLPALQEGGSEETGNLAVDGIAFAKDALAGRTAGSLNDQVAGDDSAWSGASAESFAGISLGAVPMEVRSIAFGRDNTGMETDRSEGEYTLQYTDVPDPDEATGDAQWVTIGTILLESGGGILPHLRHRFNFPAISATGLRLLTPADAAIDEIELYAESYIPPPPPALAIEPAPGYAVSWDGNDGDHFDPAAPPGGAVVPENLALATNGATPFSSSDLGPELGIGFHIAENLNDGVYGNVNSWISASADPGPRAFAGISLAEPASLTAIAWGRDNGNGEIDDSVAGTDCCGGQLDDRSLGTYTLQFTTVAAPDASTPDDDWVTIADFTYLGDADKTDNVTGGLFTEWLRHQYSLSEQDGGPIVATGIRILVPLSGIGGGTCIDEIELYGGEVGGMGPQLVISHESETNELRVSWNSREGRLYNLRSEIDPAAGDPVSWPIFDEKQDLAATPPTNTVTIPRPSEDKRFFVVEEFPAPPAVSFSDDFEGGQGEWTTGSDGLAGTAWEIGAPSNVGPPASHSASNCFGTNLAGNYGVDANVWLRSPAIDLSNAAGATISFHHFTDLETEFDYGVVRILDAVDDSELAVVADGIDGTTPQWTGVTESVPAAALGRVIRLEFRMRSDDLMNQAGWYIDDVTVTIP